MTAAGANVFEKQFLVGWMELLKPTVVGGGDVNAGDFCNYRTLDTLTADFLRLSGPFSNCYHDPQDPDTVFRSRSRAIFRSRPTSRSGAWAIT